MALRRAVAMQNQGIAQRMKLEVVATVKGYSFAPQEFPELFTGDFLLLRFWPGVGQLQCFFHGWPPCGLGFHAV